MGSLNEIGSDRQVFVYKLSPVSVVGLNAADFSRCDKNKIGLFMLQKSKNRGLVQQIELLTSASHNSAIAFFLEFPDDGGTHHTPMAGNINFWIFSHS